jgi:hypothetical protein
MVGHTAAAAAAIKVSFTIVVVILQRTAVTDITTESINITGGDIGMTASATVSGLILQVAVLVLFGVA